MEGKGVQVGWAHLGRRHRTTSTPSSPAHTPATATATPTVVCSVGSPRLSPVNGRLCLHPGPGTPSAKSHVSGGEVDWVGSHARWIGALPSNHLTAPSRLTGTQAHQETDLGDAELRPNPSIRGLSS